MLKEMCISAILLSLFCCQPSLAQSGGSVFFTRIDTGVQNQDGVNARVGGSVTAALPINTNTDFRPNSWRESSFADSQSLRTSTARRGVVRLTSEINSLLSAYIFTDRGVTTNGANHTITTNLDGQIIVNDQAATGIADAATAAVLRADYRTAPPQSSLPLNPANRFATMKSKFGFLVVGGPIETLSESLEVNDYWDFGLLIPGGPDRDADEGTTFDQYLNGALDEFRQRVIVRNTDLELIHLGGGVFVTAGSYSCTTEMHSADLWNNYVKLDFGGVNNNFVTWERILINGDRVGVSVLQHSRASALKPPNAVATDDGQLPPPPVLNFLWGFANYLIISANDNASPDGTIPPPNPVPPITLL